MTSGDACAEEVDTLETSSSLEADDVNKYDVTQVYTVELPAARADEAVYETLDDCDSSELMWELDDRLIDYDMLNADTEDADRIYQELKERALRQRRKEIKNKEIEDAIEIDESEEGTEESDSSSDFVGTEKILNLIKGYTKMEREDFTNNLPNYANKRDKRQIDILLPALKELVSPPHWLLTVALLPRRRRTNSRT